MCRLSDAQAAQIRSRYAASDVSQTHLAMEFGVTQSYISQIVRGKQRTRETVVY